jgi:hypothetical protein
MKNRKLGMTSAFVTIKPGEVADIHAGLQCFLYVESDPDDTPLREAIEFTQPKH